MNLIDFHSTDISHWRVINDGVMGGISTGSIRRSDTCTGIFDGDLSLQNNGGFASVRASIGHHDLRAYKGIEARVQGDGRTYQLRLRTDDLYDGIAWRADLPTRSNEWTVAQVPFEDFVATFRGRTPAGAPPLDPSKIHQIGFMLADRTPGKFLLEIDYVRAWPG